MVPLQHLWIKALPPGGMTGSQCFSGIFSTVPLPGKAATESRAYTRWAGPEDLGCSTCKIAPCPQLRWSKPDLLGTVPSQPLPDFTRPCPLPLPIPATAHANSSRHDWFPISSHHRGSGQLSTWDWLTPVRLPTVPRRLSAAEVHMELADGGGSNCPYAAGTARPTRRRAR